MGLHDSPPPGPLTPSGSRNSMSPYGQSPVLAVGNGDSSSSQRQSPKSPPGNHHYMREGSLTRLPSVPSMLNSRPTSALVCSYRVHVDDSRRNLLPETVKEIREHVTHAHALVLSKEPETLADNVMMLKKERNALQNDKQMLLVNKRRLEAALSRLLGLVGGALGEWEDDVRGGSRGHKVHTLSRAKVMKVLDDSKALDGKLSQPGYHFVDHEAKCAELAAQLAEIKAERDRAVKRLEKELNYRRTQAAAVGSTLQHQLAEAEAEVAKLQKRLGSHEEQMTELQGHLEFQTGELSKKVEALTTLLQDRDKELQAAKELTTGAMAEEIEGLKQQLAEAQAAAAEAAAKVSELEHAVVQRDNALSEAGQLAATKQAEMEELLAELEATRARLLELDPNWRYHKPGEEGAEGEGAEGQPAEGAEGGEGAEGAAEGAQQQDEATETDGQHQGGEEEGPPQEPEEPAGPPPPTYEELEAQLAEAKAALEEAEKLAVKAVEAEERVKELEAKVAELEKGGTDAKIASLEELVKAKDAAVAAGQRAEEAVNKLADAQVQLAQAQSQAKELEAQMKRLQEEAGVGEAGAPMREKLKLAEEKAAELARKIGDQEAQIRELQQQVMGLERDNNDLKAAMAKKKGLCKGGGC